jgi:hypothetical protein
LLLALSFSHEPLMLGDSLNVANRLAGRRAIKVFQNPVGGKSALGREIHIVLDNLSAHKTQAVEQFLADHPKVRLHFTPTYSSWLNQVETWFAKVERDVTARSIHSGI